MGQRARAAIRWLSLGLLAMVLAAASPVSARSKPVQAGAAVVDSGTFTIMIGVRKVGTETFTIRQSPDVSIASSEIKIDDGTSKARQTSEYRLTPSGELQRYEWRELSPEKSEIVVEPKDEFLVEHITTEKGKKFDQQFLLPATTLVLDDFFFRTGRFSRGDTWRPSARPSTASPSVPRRSRSSAWLFPGSTRPASSRLNMSAATTC